MNAQLLLLLLILFSMIDPALACSCIMGDAASVFNSSDFVSLVRVVGHRQVMKCPKAIDPAACDSNFAEIVYTVRHLDVYKKPRSQRHLSTQIRTAGNSAMCGVDNLTKGQQLVLSGSIEQSQLKIWLCTYAMINRKEAEQLRAKYYSG